MRRIALAVFAAALAVVTPAPAADKGGPPATLEQLIASGYTPNRMSCFVETSAAGTFLRDTREAQVGAGVGCDALLVNLLIGGGIRADFADWQNTGSLFAKLGVVLNSGVHLYGIAEWKIPDWKIRDAGQLAIGAGTEIKLELINPNLWMFTEGTVAAAKWGAAATKDDINARVGLRLKF